MVRFTRQATLKNGSYIPKAIGWATEFGGYFNETYDVELHFGLRVGGTAQMVWFVEVEDMAKFEAVNMQIMQDQKYWEIINQGSDFWLEGSLEDTLVQMIG